MKIQYYWLSLVSVLMGGIILSGIGISETVISQERSKSLFDRFIYLFIHRDNRARRAPSGRTRGGGTRDLCPTTAIALTAIVPSDQNGLAFIENTISDYPMFWFYLPYTNSYQLSNSLDSDRYIEFALFNEQETPVYIKTFPLPPKPGIVHLQLPNTSTPLKVNQKYRWVFSVVCNRLNRSGDSTVNGLIERSKPNSQLQRQLRTSNSRDRLELYLKNGFWLEAITTLAELRNSTNFQDKRLNTEWEMLLKAVNLSEVASQPLLNPTLSDITTHTGVQVLSPHLWGNWGRAEIRVK
jgi:Domain of Unknown Function (DUF928)